VPATRRWSRKLAPSTPRASSDVLPSSPGQTGPRCRVPDARDDAIIRPRPAIGETTPANELRVPGSYAVEAGRLWALRRGRECAGRSPARPARPRPEPPWNDAASWSISADPTTGSPVLPQAPLPGRGDRLDLHARARNRERVDPDDGDGGGVPREHGPRGGLDPREVAGMCGVDGGLHHVA